MENVVKNICIIYAALDNKLAENQSNMIDIEGKMVNQRIVILIDSGASHSYIVYNLVEIFDLKRSKHDK